MERSFVLDFKKPCKVYFLGIGGIGMSGIARFLHSRGFLVAGYDKTETVITKQLQAEGIFISYVDEAEKIADYDVIVYTPAIPKNQAAFIQAQTLQKPLYKRSVVLGQISQQFRTIAVAGTHGKTTTSSMVTHLLKTAGIDCTAFIGGITKNYHNNYIEGSSDVLVVEADEFDRSFLTLRPELTIVTAADPDHLDIYHSNEGFKEGFEAFVALTTGKIWLESGISELASHAKATVEIYGLTSGDFQVSNLHVNQLANIFEVLKNNKLISPTLDLHIPGFHNVSNMLAAIAVALEMGASWEQIKNGVETYQGVVRRFDIQWNTESKVYIDDYAHHPKEISATIHSVRNLLPNHQVVVAFQPHLFSRTRDFLEGFAESLDLADVVILLPIYPARELPIPGVVSEKIAELMKKAKIEFANIENVAEAFSKYQQEPFVWLSLGAGDIDTCVPKIKQLISKK